MARGLYTEVTEGVPQRARLEATFLQSAPGLADCPADDCPEVAFAGRSNAGKSSVLNRVADRRNLARTSKTPGRTQHLNLFSVRGGGRLVDLPGYGFAKVSKDAQARWRRDVETYLARRENLVGVVLVMDVRHPFEPFDRQIVEWARASALRLHVLLNKADKLGRGAQLASLRTAEATLAGLDAGTNASVQLFSATSGLGSKALIERLRTWLRHEPLPEK
jgi:GTP-binding protein